MHMFRLLTSSDVLSSSLDSWRTGADDDNSVIADVDS